MKKNIKLDEIRPQKELYQVEEDYFESLSNRIQNQTSAEPKTVFRQVWDLKWIPYAISGAFILVLGIFFGLNLQVNNEKNISDNQVINQISSETLTAYLMDDELDEEVLMEYYAENQQTSFSDFSEVSAQTLESQFADEDLDEYF